MNTIKDCSRCGGLGFLPPLSNGKKFPCFECDGTGSAAEQQRIAKENDVAAHRNLVVFEGGRQ